MKKIAAVCVVLAVIGCKGGEKPVATKTETTTTASRGATAAATTGIEVGNTLPEFAAKNLDGTPFTIASKRDKVVLLNLWATWCGPCRFEIPELQRMHDAYSARGFEVIGVSVDADGADVVKPFAEEQKIRYPLVLDQQEKLPAILQASVLPTSVLLDRNGTIVWKKVGAIFENDQELKQAIEKAL
jgi:cytochrome c biogenesis protein CcmG, thiol:disulfide interchange protein DsbE